VLVSTDKGTTWIARGEVELPKTWLIEPSIEETSKGKLIMFFRTAAGEEAVAARRNSSRRRWRRQQRQGQ
jgi:hypothetical protein